MYIDYIVFLAPVMFCDIRCFLSLFSYVLGAGSPLVFFVSLQ